MQAAVIEAVDLLGDRPLDLPNASPATVWPHDRVADALGLEQRVERFAIVLSYESLGPHGRHRIALIEAFGVAHRSILDAAVAEGTVLHEVLEGG